jgi:hypothetical protein
VGDLGDPYANVDDLRAYLSMQEDDRFNDLLEQALDSVSREIEQYCNRQFNKTAAATPRIFRVLAPPFVIVDDFHTTAGLVIESGTGFGTVWGASDYELQPLNGVVNGQPGWPYNKIVPLTYPLVRGDRIRVTVPWGWDAVPAPVKQSSLIMAGATFQIKDAPFGVAGSDQWGSIRVKDNAMAQTKLNRYVVDRILVG